MARESAEAPAERSVNFGDDIISAVQNWGEKALLPVTIIMGRQAEQFAKNREAFKRNDIKLTEAHAAACSALMNLISRSSGRSIDDVSGDRANQMNLTVHFAIGINHCEVAIVEGSYVQAAALVRQEHEVISAMQEAGAGKRKDGRTPHATIGVLKNMGRTYGELSGATHVSQAEFLHAIVQGRHGNLTGPSIFPIYNRELAQNLYSLHVCYIVFMTRLVSEVNITLGLPGLSDDELYLLANALHILNKEGLIKLLKDAPLDQTPEMSSAL